MNSLTPTDPALVKRQEVPHKKLKEGLHLMVWNGWEVIVDVHVHRLASGASYRVYHSGNWNLVSWVPEAKFYRLPKELQ